MLNTMKRKYTNYEDCSDRCEDRSTEREPCWNCEGPIAPGTAVVTLGGIFCSEDCHEAFTTAPEPESTTRKDMNNG
jgi:hypothetical protein